MRNRRLWFQFIVAVLIGMGNTWVADPPLEALVSGFVWWCVSVYFMTKLVYAYKKENIGV